MPPQQVETPSEQSPLLGDRNSAPNGDFGNDDERQAADAGEDGVEEVVFAEEASNKKLIAVLFTLFIGVFFAALGKSFCIQPRPSYSY